MYKLRLYPEVGTFRTRLEYAVSFVLNDCREVSNEGFLRDRFIGALCFLLSPLEIRPVYRATFDKLSGHYLETVDEPAPSSDRQ